jgi:hypothetical protein
MPETIFDSYFLVNFKHDAIIKWGSEKDMYRMQYHLIYLDLDVVAFQNLTQKMKSSLEFYTNNKEKKNENN